MIPCKNWNCRYRITYHENTYQKKVLTPKSLKKLYVPMTDTGFGTDEPWNSHWNKSRWYLSIFIYVIKVAYWQYLFVLLFCNILNLFSLTSSTFMKKKKYDPTIREHAFSKTVSYSLIVIHHNLQFSSGLIAFFMCSSHIKDLYSIYD